jgi:hypothetical protein
MAQAMWPHSWQPGSRAGPLEDITDQVRPDRSAGGPAGEEQMAGSLRVAAAGQVSHQGLTDLRGQREPVVAASLAADDEFPGPPVHIVQLQARDLDRAQAQPRDQRHDREVADANRAAAVTAVEHPLDVRGGHGGRRQGGQPPPTDWRHGRPERQRCDALQIQESQDRAELRHPPLGRPGRDATTLPQQEGVDVHPGQRGRLEHPIGRRLFL